MNWPLSFYSSPDAMMIVSCMVLGALAGVCLAPIVYALPRVIEASWKSLSCEATGMPVEPTRPIWTRARRAWKDWPFIAAAIVVFGGCAWRFGASSHLWWALVFSAALLMLAFIDARTTLLPDVLTIPLLWLGLLFNSVAGWTSLWQAVWGAACSYLLLWSVYHAFRMVTGREGMGYGDFKLLAAIGAWFGLAIIPWVLLGAATMGVCVGVTLRLFGRLHRNQPMAFGPYLVAAGLAVLLWPDDWPGLVF